LIVSREKRQKPLALPSGGRLILASASPRRRQLLEEAGWEFQVIVPTVAEPETRWHLLGPKGMAEALAYFKARSIWDANPSDWVLGADTIVARGEEVIGKAADEVEARTILGRLCGTRHAVITGLAILGPGSVRLIASDTTFIRMRNASPAEIQAYLDSGEWRGKAGAYAIQETGDRFVESVEGSFTNVVGLPMELLRRMIERISRGQE
jgi:septum formation protein